MAENVYPIEKGPGHMLANVTPGYADDCAYYSCRICC